MACAHQRSRSCCGSVAFPATATAADPAAESGRRGNAGPATYSLDQDALADVLRGAPDEGQRPVGALTISVPSPDGGFERFAVVESPVMEPGLAAAHPEIKTYTARGLDDPSASARLDLTPLGFHASVRSASGAWYVDPRDGEHVAYRREATAAPPFEEPAAASSRGRLAPRARSRPAATRSRCASTGWRCSRTRPTRRRRPGTTTAAKAVLVNRLNQVYEQDLAIRLLLVAGNDQLNLDTAADRDRDNGPCGAAACYTAQQLQRLHERDARPHQRRRGPDPGRRSYDLAHLVMAAHGGGLAGLGVVGTASRAAPARRSRTRSGTRSRSTSSPTRWATSSARSTRSTAASARATSPGRRRCASSPGAARRSWPTPARAWPTICRTTRIRTSRRSRSRRSTRRCAGPRRRNRRSSRSRSTASAPVTASRSATTACTSAPGHRRRQLHGERDRGRDRGDRRLAGGAKVAVTQVSRARLHRLFLRPGGAREARDRRPGRLRRRLRRRRAVAGTTRYGGTPQATANRTPSVALKGAAAYTIPARTPFLLDARAPTSTAM